MADTSIRRVSLAEQAEAAARRFVETGEPEPNPHKGTDDEQPWRSLYERWLLALTADEGTEGSA
jgi:hypothetical protein